MHGSIRMAARTLASLQCWGGTEHVEFCTDQTDIAWGSGVVRGVFGRMRAGVKMEVRVGRSGVGSDLGGERRGGGVFCC